jgi:hypothetical protein
LRSRTVGKVQPFVVLDYVSALAKVEVEVRHRSETREGTLRYRHSTRVYDTAKRLFAAQQKNQMSASGHLRDMLQRPKSSRELDAKGRYRTFCSARATSALAPKSGRSSVQKMSDYYESYRLTGKYSERKRGFWRFFAVVGR